MAVPEAGVVGKMVGEMGLRGNSIACFEVGKATSVILSEA